ncbi:MAG: cytochrome c-type biogenesis protein CcmH [Anaerolineales bacterium]|nr:cytochrome c-type biogenesis protein CcmH [Anaerolineales bacterium]
MHSGLPEPTPRFRLILAGAVSLFTLLVITLPALPAAAQDITPPPDDAVNAIAEQMYCPVCEGVPLDACETKACQQWREDIRDRLAAGWSEQEIKEYFVLQYGDQVLAAPPPRGFSLLMYVVPAVALTIGAFFLGKTVWHWQAQNREEGLTGARNTGPQQNSSTGNQNPDSESE